MSHRLLHGADQWHLGRQAVLRTACSMSHQMLPGGSTQNDVPAFHSYAVHVVSQTTPCAANAQSGLGSKSVVTLQFDAVTFSARLKISEWACR